MFILAELTSKSDISGVLCLASILFLFIALLAYAGGPVVGSCTCLFLFIITIFATGDSSSSGGQGAIDYSPNKVMIANKSQTRIIPKYKYSINSPGCIFETPLSMGREEGTETIFIPAEEMYVDSEGWRHMKATGKRIDLWEDSYIYNETYDPINVSVEDGGSGVPTWVYHPASPTWIFGIGGLPALLGGAFIASKAF